MIVLDSNVLSAMMFIDREPVIAAWLAEQTQADLTTTTVSIFEVRFGIARLPAGRRKLDFVRRLDNALKTFLKPIEVFDEAAATAAAEIHAIRGKARPSIQAPDTMIAGLVKSRRGVLATRNSKDFRGLGITLVDPWSS